ncbi:MAG: PD40 domain-containing protein [Bacteroidetes bacterium]|nr:PD40 domain-containing protein [Bacteroidota bacterium]
MKIRLAVFIVSVVLCSFADHPQERHLLNIRQLTFGGDNAEAYFSPNGKYLSFQSNNPAWGLECDQIFRMHIESAAQDSTYRPDFISTGDGRTTCSYFMPNGRDILYASTHKGSANCPHEPPKGVKYFWSIYDDYDIYVANQQGNIKAQLTNTIGYDAEATVSPLGDKIVFTSNRSGDLELWTMNLDGTEQVQITDQLGYDGGAFFSPDGQHLVFRASRPRTPKAIAEYRQNLRNGLVAPTEMEIFTCRVDGSEMKQITHLGKANWAPYFHPSGDKIIFSSNHRSDKGFDFHLYLINIDGSGLEQITFESKFNAFPMFSPDGKKLVFSSNRNNGGGRDTNLFIAEWED